MTLPRFTHIMPSSVEEVLEVLSQKGEVGSIKAGGTDLMAAMKHRTIAPDFLVNINGLDELDFIRTDQEEGMVIGCLTTLTTISQSERVKKKYPILAKAAGKVASPQIRNIGTLVGNVCLNTRCWYYNQSEQWRRSIPKCYKMGGGSMSRDKEQ